MSLKNVLKAIQVVMSLVIFLFNQKEENGNIPLWRYANYKNSDMKRIQISQNWEFRYIDSLIQSFSHLPLSINEVCKRHEWKTSRWCVDLRN